jgi:hypothetical protein
MLLAYRGVVPQFFNNEFRTNNTVGSFEGCFPGQTFALKTGESNLAKPKIDVDKVRADAREAKSIAEGGVAKDQKAAPKKKKVDLSFLDAALK